MLELWVPGNGIQRWVGGGLSSHEILRTLPTVASVRVFVTSLVTMESENQLFLALKS